MKPRVLILMFTAILLLSLTVVPSLSHGAEDPWQFLDDFTPVPRSLTRIGEHYVAMLFESREQRLFAAVIFNASWLPASVSFISAPAMPLPTQRDRTRACTWSQEKQTSWH